MSQATDHVITRRSLVAHHRPGGASRRASAVDQIDRSIAIAEATFTTAIKPRAAPANGKGGLSGNQSASES